jgi:hypothetical protein
MGDGRALHQPVIRKTRRLRGHLIEPPPLDTPAWDNSSNRARKAAEWAASRRHGWTRCDAWGALDSTYFIGGSTEVDGIKNDDRQENWRLGATLSVPIDRRRSIKLYGSTGVTTGTGSDYNAIGVLLQYRWGAGL